MTAKLLSIFCLQAFFIQVWAQSIPIPDNNNSKIRYYVNEAGIKQQVEFLNDSGVVQGVFDIVANNPYNKFDFPVSGISREGMNIYHVKNPLETAVGKYLSGYSGGEVWLSSSFDISRHPEDFIAVSYLLGFFNEEGSFGEIRHSKLLVVNNAGKTVFEMDEIPTNITFPIVTENGKYAAFQYGSPVDESENAFTEGFRIIGIPAGEVYADKVVYGLKMPTSKDNWLKFIAHEGENYRYFYFDGHKGVLSDKLYSREEAGNDLGAPPADKK